MLLQEVLDYYEIRNFWRAIYSPISQIEYLLLFVPSVSAPKETFLAELALVQKDLRKDPPHKVGQSYSALVCLRDRRRREGSRPADRCF